MRATRCYIAVTGPCDSNGKTPFTMFWIGTGEWRSDSSRIDGKPVGYRRAQCFRAVVSEYIARGCVLVGSESEAERLGHAPGGRWL